MMPADVALRFATASTWFAFSLNTPMVAKTAEGNMAELSHQDKLILLGPDYVQKEAAERERRRQQGGLTPEEKRARYLAWRTTAAFITAVAAILFATHVFKGTNYDPKLAMGSGIVALVGVLGWLAAHFAARGVNVKV